MQDSASELALTKYIPNPNVKHARALVQRHNVLAFFEYYPFFLIPFF